MLIKFLTKNSNECLEFYVNNFKQIINKLIKLYLDCILCFKANNPLLLKHNNKSNN